jgi:hypothetical protein
MWAGPFGEFPRQLGYPSRGEIVYTMKEFLDKINLHNGRTTVFSSLYAFDKINSDGKPDYDSARIGHLFFDLDGDNCHTNVNRLHEYFIRENLQHMIFFSGGGFHTYVRCCGSIRDKKSAIFNAVTDVADKVGLTVGINEHSDIDAHTVGNLAQLVRVPNTWNIKRKKFCIPVNEDLLNQDLHAVQTYAEKQHFQLTTFGEQSLDLTLFDREPIEKYRIPVMDFGDSIGIDNINIDSFPPCIKALLTKKLIKHRQRFIVIEYCKEIGLPLKDTISLLKHYLEPRVYNHCVYEERQPVFIYRRGDLGFPGCEKLRQEGLCNEKEICKK